MRISDGSSDVCSSDLEKALLAESDAMFAGTSAPHFDRSVYKPVVESGDLTAFAGIRWVNDKEYVKIDRKSGVQGKSVASQFRTRWSACSDNKNTAHITTVHVIVHNKK